MVIVIGNRFMHGVYVSKEVVKDAHKGFNNTMHDLNHMGSGYALNPFSVVPSDISYIVGWQDGLSYDKATGEVRGNVHIKETATRYSDWKNYIEISAEIGRVPNVSMFIYGRIEYTLAKDLPKDSHYRKEGYKADDMVPCMAEMIPFMVSTVTKGSCNDKDGCGIKHSKIDNMFKSCDGGTCNIKKESPDIKQISDPNAEKINKRKERIEKRLKYLKGGK